MILTLVLFYYGHAWPTELLGGHGPNSFVAILQQQSSYAPITSIQSMVHRTFLQAVSAVRMLASSFSVARALHKNFFPWYYVLIKLDLVAAPII